MGARRIRREQRQQDMAESRRVNGMRKMKEHERRHARMVEIIKKGKLDQRPAGQADAPDHPGGRREDPGVRAISAPHGSYFPGQRRPSQRCWRGILSDGRHDGSPNN
jgi:hypothetical protein